MSFCASAGTDFSVINVSFEQMYMYPVLGLYADGGQFAPPSAPGAVSVKPVSSYGSKMHPIRLHGFCRGP